MELPHVGRQCAHSHCKQLDFLPLLCKCKQQFCSEHFNLHVRQCTTTVDVQIEGELQRITDVHRCSHEGCNETSLVPIICERCNHNFCVKHRHFSQCYGKDEKTLAAEKEKIAAPVREFNEAKALVDKQIEERLSEAKKKGKKGSLVNKVQLMKIKNKAKGLSTIPTVDRIYFNVFQRKGDEGHPVFVSKTWSVGRAIDAIADECKLKNENNKAGSRKLRLFKKETDELVAANLGESLDSLVTKSVIVDGDSLVIAYVDD